MSRARLSWLRLGPLTELPRSVLVSVQVDELSLALCQVGDELYLVDGTCPHQAGPLADGSIEGPTLRCPLHGWRYDLRTGARLDRAGAPLATYDVRAERGWVEALLPEPGAAQ